MILKITHQLFLCAGLFLSANAFAAPEGSTPSLAPQAEIQTKLATKTEWASGLKEPQGMAHHGNDILLADYGAGKVLRYSRDGKLLGTVAEGLKSPSQIAIARILRATEQDGKIVKIWEDENIAVSERKANRVIQIDKDGKITPLGDAIEEPLGLVSDSFNNLFAVSHTTSTILRFDGTKWTPFFTPTEADRYGYRCLAMDNGTLLLSDEESGEILMLSQSGRLATWAKGIADPSGITIGPDNAAYVTDESNGGRLWRVNNLGEKTIVAEGLGRPRGVLFLDEKTALVSDRNGKVWKLVFPDPLRPQ